MDSFNKYSKPDLIGHHGPSEGYVPERAVNGIGVCVGGGSVRASVGDSAAGAGEDGETCRTQGSTGRRQTRPPCVSGGRVGSVGRPRSGSARCLLPVEGRARVGGGWREGGGSGGRHVTSALAAGHVPMAAACPLLSRRSAVSAREKNPAIRERRRACF